MASIIDIQISYKGKSPITGTNSAAKRVSVDNLSQLLLALNHGGRYKQGNSYVQVQETLVAASATATCVSVVAGNTVTIAGTALTATKQRASGTITCATALAAQTITVNGVVFTAVSGAATLGTATFSIDTGDTETAASIVTQVNAYESPLIRGLLTAKSAAGVVTFYADTPGTAGNSLTITSSDNGTLAVSAIAGGVAIANNQFDFTTDDLTATSLAYAINNSTTAAIQRVTATAATNVCTITAKVAGVAGNAITLTSVGGTITVTGSGYLADGSAGEPVRWAF